MSHSTTDRTRVPRWILAVLVLAVAISVTVLGIVVPRAPGARNTALMGSVVVDRAIPPEPRATARTAPSATTYTALRSSLYGYTILVPSGTTLHAGSERWTVLVPPATEGVADAIEGRGWRVTIVSTVPVPGLTPKLLADILFNSDPRWAGATCAELDVDPPRWWFTRVGPAHGMARLACGMVQAVVGAGDRLFALTFHSTAPGSAGTAPNGRPAALAAFERSVADIRFSPPAPTPPPSPSRATPPSNPAPLVRYTSDPKGYSIALPADWKRSSTEGGHTDRFTAPGGTTLRISRHPLAAGSSALAWATARVPDRADLMGTARVCEFRGWAGGITIIGGPGTSVFRETELVGRPAAIRGLCGYVDAVIDAGDHLLYLSLRARKPQPSGDLTTFEDVVRRLSLRVSS